MAQADVELWQQMYETNVLGTLRVTKALLPALVAADGEGVVVNVGSIAGFLAYEGGGGYTVAKHGVHVMTETLRLELVDQPVRITLVAPGMVRTEEFSLTRFAGDQERADAVYAGVPNPLVAEDVADAIVWMATRPAHVNIDLLVVKPRVQAAPHKVHREPRPPPDSDCGLPRFCTARQEPCSRTSRRRSGLAAADLPRGGVAEVALTDAAEDQPVVQPVAPAGPELDLVGHDPEAAPEVGHRHVVVAAVVGEGRRPGGVLRLELARASRSARTAARPTPRCATPTGRESKYCSTSSRDTSTAVPRNRIARYIAGQVSGCRDRGGRWSARAPWSTSGP